ncbi:eukaryotic translation initiation factor 1b isoform X1 [Fukomys damarensis]|uniref:eukaryotic translation initiation factor 1b isoform X1 n=1 Tax=Fukomys damarensis TaxID=885580 RepID=UPI0005401219|nr:eukaryotic translation initiation factor 1b isoform X1 [Fukomys damarensis]
MSTIQNLQSFDPFADATKGDDLLPAGTEDYIHIRIQQRNGRKTLTTVQGIADDYDKKKLVKAFKKKFACNGTVIEHPEYGEVIQLQGDQRKNICQFLLEPFKLPFPSAWQATWDVWAGNTQGNRSQMVMKPCVHLNMFPMENILF